MDTSDLIGKIIFEILIFIAAILFLGGTEFYHIVLALFLAHTVNWLVNTHFWDFGRFLGITLTSQELFFPYLEKIQDKVKRNVSISSVIVIGSISRNQRFKTTSDIDMIFIRGKGLKNALKAVLVTIRERARAYIRRWAIEETIRFIKQSYEMEDVRVLRYRSLKNLMPLVLAEAAG